MAIPVNDKKRKAPYDPIRDVRTAKNLKTTQDARFELHPSYMVTLTTAMPQATGSGEPQVIDVRVVGTFMESARAQTALLEALNDGFTIRKSAESTCINEIHRTENDSTGQLCIIQRDLPSNGAQDCTRNGWLRIGEVIPKQALKLQQTLIDNSVYYVSETASMGYDEESSSIVAVYRSLHEANQYVIRQFHQHGGLDGISASQKKADSESDGGSDDGCDSDEEWAEAQDDHESRLCFVGGFARAKVTGEEDWITWEVEQKSLL